MLLAYNRRSLQRCFLDGAVSEEGSNEDHRFHFCNLADQSALVTQGGCPPLNANWFRLASLLKLM